MATQILEKYRLWSEDGKGLKTVTSTESPALSRDDIPDVIKQRRLDQSVVLGRRGEVAQDARLRYYPSINVDRDQLYAGYIEGSLQEARDKLSAMGYRNNPTAYVEVTEENGPDNGSFARQYITEEGVSPSRQRLTNFPSIFKRAKRQIHVCFWKVEDRVEFLAHEEKSAWMQPMLHVGVNDVKAEVGVRDFRDDWHDNFGEELAGKEDISWESTH